MQSAVLLPPGMCWRVTSSARKHVQWRIQDFPDRGHLLLNTEYKNILLPPATKLGQGYIFTGICHSVNREGRGVCFWGGAWSRGGVCSRGNACSGGVCSGGVSAPGGLVPGGCLMETPRRPLLRAVRIVLECIFVWQGFCQKLHEHFYNSMKR